MATTSLPRSSQQPGILDRWLARAYLVNWELVAYGLILVLAVITRFGDLGTRVMSHDESLHTYYSWRLSEAGDFQHQPLMHGPILFHVTALFYWLFGANDFTSRIYPAVLGVILTLSPLLFRRWLGRWGALLASVMLLASPLLMYYERYIRHDTPSILSAVLMVYGMFMYLDGPPHLRRRARWLYLVAGMMIWNLGSKETAFIYIAIFGLFIAIYWFARLYQSWRRKPIRRLYNAGMVAILIGAVTALVMYMVFSIALSNFSTLDARLAYLSEQVRFLFTGQPLGYEFTIFMTWTLLVVGVVIAILVVTAVWASSRHAGRLRALDIMLVLLMALAVCIALIAVEEITQRPARATTEVAVPEGGGEGISALPPSNTPIYAAWVAGIAIIGVLVYSSRAGWWRRLHRFPELDLIIVIGTLIFPWLAAFLIKATGANPTDYTAEGIQRAAFAVIPFIAVSVVTGLVWNWRRWVICVLVFYIPYAFFFTTMFTNPDGLASGMIGSLGYWLEQQAVERGSQPRYYYALVVMPIYEFLPMIGAFLAMLAGLARFWRSQLAPRLWATEVDTTAVLVDENREAVAVVEERTILLSRDPGWLGTMPFIVFVAWWGVFNFIAYTLAGEKMPWLGTHMTVPLIFLAGWYFGRVFANVNWAVFRWRGWLYLLLLPLFMLALFQAVSPFLVGQSPFAGLEREQLMDFYLWLATVAVALVSAYLIFLLVMKTGITHLSRMVGAAVFLVLSLITFRAAWVASFINYDYANEYLVYAHAAPGIKQMMAQIEDVSLRTTDGMNVDFAWGGNAWPVTWYFRDLTNARFFAGNPTPGLIGDAVMVYASDDIRARVEPLLEDRYYRYEYIRMWWPDQEYFYLTAQRVMNTFDFSPENTQAAEIRRGIFDIWWKRDYSRYGTAIGRDYSLQNWPVSERFSLYVRKDIAAQVWNLGVGDGTVMNPLEDQQVNICVTNWQQKYADVVFGEATGTQLVHPLDVTVDEANNRVYVAEEFANRISVFDMDGGFITALQGGEGDFIEPFNRPNGVAVGADGNLYVADTWNYRIREFAPTGSLITAWGQPDQSGEAAQMIPVDGFWGPRDVAVDAAGNVYVADTGNKRVRVYSGAGEYLYDIGSAGAALGQLNEPSGLAIDDDAGLLYVADTWNKRVSVFTLTGTPQFTFAVRGWYEDQGNRPYLAIDGARNLIYVGDPDAGRVLVYDTAGNCVGSFGQPSDTVVDTSQFDTVAGIATDADGNVYVADSAAGRVLKFAPFVDTVMPELSQDLSGEVIPVEPLPEMTDEVTAELLPEATGEITVEAAG